MCLQACLRFVFLLFLTGCFTTAHAQQAKKQVRWIVKLKGERSIDLLLREASARGRTFTSFDQISHKVEKLHPANHVYLLSAEGFHEVSSFEDLMTGSDLSQHIEYMEKDAVGYAAGYARTTNTPDDPVFSSQWYLENTGEFSFGSLQATEGADISMIDAWNITTGDPGITVAILDTGIRPDLVEFNGRLWENEDEIPANGLDDDGNGFVDDIYGWDFVNEDADPTDDGGHGSAVAGIVGANTNNTEGIAGIDQQCKLMICKVLDRNQTGFFSDWAAGIYYAVDNGARVINMSMTGDQDLRVLSDAVRYAADKGVLIVCSMGNSNVSDPFYPAAYPSTVAVGSTDPDDKRSVAFNDSPSFGSNFGDHINIAAPGNAIFGLSLSGGTTVWSGTSMSSAVVSGVASLVLSVNRELTANLIKAALYRTAKDGVGDEEDSDGWDRFFGFGRVDAFEAISYVSSAPSFQDPFSLSLFPNPTSSNEIQAAILLSSLELVKIQMVNMQGMTNYEEAFIPTSQSAEFRFDLEGYGTGLYLLTIEQGGKRCSQRFMISAP